jgi:hypothetical protein
VGLLNSQANALIVVGTPLMGAAIERSETSTALWLVAVLWVLPLLVRPRSTRRAALRADPAPPRSTAVEQR